MGREARGKRHEARGVMVFLLKNLTINFTVYMVCALDDGI